MASQPLLLFVLSILSVSFALDAHLRGVHPKEYSLYSSSTFRCIDNSQSIPSTQVNDDFCDCADGSDEPGTAACSGKPVKFYCLNKGYKGEFIRTSRVNDGVCDCCDSSDEYEGRIQCPNTCLELSEKAKAGLKARLATLEEGLRAKMSLIEKGLSQQVEHQSKFEELRQKVADHESALAQVRETKEALEKADAEEKERLNKLREEAAASAPAPAPAPAAEHVAEHAPETPSTETHAASADSSSSGGSAFPYPAHYAAPPSPAAESAAAPAPSSAFPYPAQYAAPPQATEAASESHDHKHDEHNDEHHDDHHDEHHDDHHDDHHDEHHDDHHDEHLQTPEQHDTHKHEEPAVNTALESARTAYYEAQNKLTSIQREYEEVQRLMNMDFGPNRVFAPLYKQCFSLDVRQYTYEVCFFDRAAQKEGHSSTSLGSWSSWGSNPTYQKMQFENGQTCWQGPARSIEVEFVCDSTNRIISVDEPSRCVYHAIMGTPIACHDNELEDVRKKLNSPDFFEHHMHDEL